MLLGTSHGPRRAVLLVRNGVTHDARVRRAAGVLRDLGYDTWIVGVVTHRDRDAYSEIAGFPVVRLDPQSPFTRAAALVGCCRRTGGTLPGPDERIQATRIPAPPGAFRRLHRLLRTIDFYRRAFRLVRRLDPVVLHCNDYNTMWVGALARLRSRAAIVYDAHELWPDRNLRPEPRWWLLLCEFALVRFADRTITASPGYAAVMARRYRIPLPGVVRNIPVRSDGDLPRRPRRGAPGRSPTVVYAGAVTRYRGLEQAIVAMPELPDLRLRIIGPCRAGYDAELRALAEHEGVANRVIFEPEAPTEDLIGQLRSADAGLLLIQPVCLSYRLTLPNKLFEYLAAGLPVISSDIPVMGEFVRREGIGIVVPPSDRAAIVAAIASVIDPNASAAVRAAVAKTASSHTWRHEAGRLVDLYREASRIRVSG